MASAPPLGAYAPADGAPGRDLLLTRANFWSKYAGNPAACQLRLTIADIRSAALACCGDGDGGICNDKKTRGVTSCGVFLGFSFGLSASQHFINYRSRDRRIRRRCGQRQSGGEERRHW